MKPTLTRILTVAALLVGIFISSSYGQAFTIESFDGDKQLLHVASDESKRTLSIKCANDAIYIGGLNNLDTVQMLNKHFLMITYQLRTGVGMQELTTLIISINNHKLCESLHVVSLFREEFIDYDFSKSQPPSTKASVKTIYKVDLSLAGNNSANYKIRAKAHDERKSTDEPKGNYNNNQSINLTFDQTSNIFYSSREKASQYFTIRNAKTESEAKEYIKGTFPVVRLGNHKYYYKARQWYEWYDGSYLHQESYREPRFMSPAGARMQRAPARGVALLQ